MSVSSGLVSMISSHGSHFLASLHAWLFLAVCWAFLYLQIFLSFALRCSCYLETVWFFLVFAFKICRWDPVCVQSSAECFPRGSSPQCPLVFPEDDSPALGGFLTYLCWAVRSRILLQSPQFAPLRYPVLGIAATFFSLDFQLYPFNSGIPSGSTRTPCPELWPGNPLQAVSRDTGSTHLPCFPPLRDRCPYCLMSAVFQTIVLYILFVCLFWVVSGKRIYLVLLLHLAGGRSIHEQVS